MPTLETINVGFIGSSESGKTSLITKYINDELYPFPLSPTAGINRSSHSVNDDENQHINIYDFSGSRAFDLVPDTILQDLHLINFCIPCHDELTKNNQYLTQALTHILTLLRQNPQSTLTIGFVITKADNRSFFEQAKSLVDQLKNQISESDQSSRITISELIVTSKNDWTDNMRDQMDAQIKQCIAHSEQDSKLEEASETTSSEQNKPPNNIPSSSCLPKLSKSILGVGLFFGTASVVLSAVTLTDLAAGITWFAIASTASGGLTVACLIVACVMLYQHYQQQTTKPEPSLPLTTESPKIQH